MLLNGLMNTYCSESQEAGIEVIEHLYRGVGCLYHVSDCVWVVQEEKKMKQILLLKRLQKRIPNRKHREAEQFSQLGCGSFNPEKP